MKTLVSSASELVVLGDAYIQKHGPNQFHLAASELLYTAKLHELFDFESLVKDSLSSAFKSSQNYATSQFSHFPLTVASGNHCSLDLYFWYRSPTVIHNHHFTGAFQCLKGVNVDFEFEFDGDRAIGNYHELGQLKLKKTRRLLPGDIAQIDLLDKFIHQNHHQAELTVNACFRTPDIGLSNLSNYLYSGLRYEKHPELVARTHRLWNFLFLGDFKPEHIEFTLDEAISFLLQHSTSQSGSPRFAQLSSMLDQKVRAESGIEVAELLKDHHLWMDELENQYD